MGFGEEEVEKTSFLKLDVEGKDPFVWEKCKADLLKMIAKMMETQINSTTGSTVEDELKRLGSNIIEFANAKLQKPTLENEKLVAEIGLILTNVAQSTAATRKMNAEAESIELDNIAKKLKIAFGAARMIASMEGNQEGLVFCKDMEALVAQFSSQPFLEKGDI